MEALRKLREKLAADHRARGAVILAKRDATALDQDFGRLIAALADSPGEVRTLYEVLVDADDAARRRGDRFGLCDSFDTSGTPYPSQHSANVVQRARLALGRAVPTD